MMKNTKDGRVSCGNWDKPKVRVRAGGVGHLAKRFVDTQGTDVIPAHTMIRAIVESLRCGNDVRLTDENGKECIRIYPMVDAEGKMYAAAQTLSGGSLRNCLTDKRPVMFSKGKQISLKEYDRVCNAKKTERVSVTADMVVTCPECGFEFRVGKQLGVDDGQD